MRAGGAVGAAARALLGTAVTGLLVLTLSAAPARAGGRDDAIRGDFDGDGVSDTATLGSTAGVSVDCRITVSTAVGSTRTYHYLNLAPGQYCPDLGTAAQIDGKGADEIVLAWFAGAPPGIDHDLVTLRLFKVVGTARAIWQPSFLGNADFNGDGRGDVYEWTDQGEGYQTYLSTGTGTFVPGPQRFAAQPTQLVVRDLNHNAAQDTLLSYFDSSATGVVVLLDSGATESLQRDESGETAWTSQVVNANGDRFPDVLTTDRRTGARQYFVNTGTGSFVPAPRAVPDRVTAKRTGSTTISVLANDYIGPETRVTISTAPTHGTARVTSSGAIGYTPRGGAGRNDRLVYQITTQGRTSRAAVTIGPAG